MYKIIDRANGEILYAGANLELAQSLLLKYSKKGYNCLLLNVGNRVIRVR